MSHDKSVLEILARGSEIEKYFTATEINSASTWGKKRTFFTDRGMKHRLGRE